MSRKYTQRNFDPPHYQLKAFLQKVKVQLRTLSAKDFKERFDSEFDTVLYAARTSPDAPVPTDIPKGRPAQMEFILKNAEERYKSAWAEKVGWAFDAMGSEQQDLMRKNVYERINAINKSGYAGILSDGMIVDRRLHPEAMPIPENKMLGIPKAKDLPTK